MIGEGQGIVTEYGALGPSRASRSIENQGRRIGIAHRRPGTLIHQNSIDAQFRSEIRFERGQLFAFDQRVERSGRRAQFEDGQECDDEFNSIR